jgi:membrane-bound lytic murein transglycosylase D
MPATARSLGLSLFPTDQRLNPEKNATAAARYLKILYDRFHDWPLVLAAYNAGEGRVNGLIRHHKAGTYEQISTHLPAETQMYVPKVNATLLRREGIGLADLSPL